MNYSDYRIKLGIGFSDDQKFVALKNKILNFIDFLYRASPSTSFDYTYTDHLLFMTSIGEKIDEDNDDDLYEVKSGRLHFKNHLSHMYGRTGHKTFLMNMILIMSIARMNYSSN